MYCEHCGAKLEDGARYCWKCGARIEEEETAGRSEEKKKSRWAPMNILLILLLVLLVFIFCFRQFIVKEPKSGSRSGFGGGDEYISVPGSEIKVTGSGALDSMISYQDILEPNQKTVAESDADLHESEVEKEEPATQKKLTEEQYVEFENFVDLVTEWSFIPEKLPLSMTEIPLNALQWNMLCKIHYAHSARDPRFIDESEKIGYEVSECRISEEDLQEFCEENYGKAGSALIEAAKEDNYNLVYQNGVFHYNSVALWGDASPYYATIEKAEPCSDGIIIRGHVVKYDWMDEKEFLVATYSSLFDTSEKTASGYEFNSIQYEVPDDEFSGKYGIFLCDLNGLTRYANADGRLAREEWIEGADEDWYYFDAEGHMVRDQWIDGMYYVGSDGRMLKDTITPDGYRVGPDGAWISDTQ